MSTLFRTRTILLAVGLLLVLGCTPSWFEEGEIGSAYTGDGAAQGPDHQEYYRRMRAHDPMYGQHDETDDVDQRHPWRAEGGWQRSYDPGPLQAKKPAPEAETPNPEFTDRTPQYHIRPGDKLRIMLPYQEEEGLSVAVRPDGRITYRFGVETMAAGRTFKQVKLDLEDRLSAYYKNPTVTVIGETFTGNTVFVMGPVDHPGAHVIQGDTRLLEVLANAGAFDKLPTPAGLTFKRSENEEDLDFKLDLDSAYMARNNEILPIDFRALMEGRDLSQNIPLQTGDFIFFPSTYDRDKRIYLVGDVPDPQVFYYSGKTSLLDMMLIAGGVNAISAQQRGVYVIRKGLPKPIKADFFKVKEGKIPDVPLKNNDIVYVPERTLHRRSREISSVIGEIITPMQTLLQLHDTSDSYMQKEWRLDRRRQKHWDRGVYDN